MPLSAEELVNALHEAAAAKNVDNFVAVAGVLEDQVDETFVQQKKGQLRRVIKLYRQIQKEEPGSASSAPSRTVQKSIFAALHAVCTRLTD